MQSDKNFQKRYLNYNQVLKSKFEERIQKISVHGGFTCPNRDGTKGRGGCTYCNNQTFVPEYCKPVKSITQQLDEGVEFFHHKYQNQYYLAYFQSYTNTYDSFENLISLYEEALRHPKIKGLVIGTRPDCVSEELLDYFEEISKNFYLLVEYGVESTLNATLEFIRRGHDFACAELAVQETARRGIRTGAHLILGLPHESREMILAHADKISHLPLTSLKLHQLQIVKGTVMATQYRQHPEWFQLFTVDEYVDLVVDFLERLSPNIAIERFVSQSPEGMVIAPQWKTKNFEITSKIEKQLIKRNTFQGRFWQVR
ncbi:MAG: TIGR01212 family radical SAM protein [Paludibacteraceae bacterium]|nr:TIGR01212 family radical SAM protein [Paludibacteraceae bacterium]